ncbi:MAG: hypothetical protein JXA11_11305 [Phycisphaerae bacterium]|nr:hypothetical protein [Phycisphaerae bacterium]
MNEHSQEQNNHFGLIVTGLLIVIIVALAGLWLIEKGNRKRAEQTLLELQTASQKKLQTMGTMLVQQMEQAKTNSVNRDQLATQEVDWNGLPRTVLLLSAADGEKLGFQPDDAILVTPPPTTQPTTQATNEEP